MAALHGRCFTTPRPWLAAEFAELLAQPAVFAVVRGAGFALGRCVVDEAELMTLAVDPPARRRGLGRTLLAEFEAAAAARGASRGLLEVAAPNAVARALYASAGWGQIACRPGYYAGPDGASVDALVFDKALPAADRDRAFAAAEKR